MRRLFFCGAVLSVSLVLSGCHETIPDAEGGALGYSPRFTHIRVYTEDGRYKQVLVPEACLATQAEPAKDEELEPRLPPGCANNFNLQRMVERKTDLTKGRPLGSAPAAPAARAAQGYLDGTAKPVLGGAVVQGGATGEQKTTIELPVQSPSN